MSKIDNLLSRLSKAKRTGKDSYIACCPAHDDKNPSMTIREIEPDKILLHCFAGCSVEEITGSVGLSIGDIMPDSAPDKIRKPSAVPFNPRDVLECISSDAHLICLFISDVTKGKEITGAEAHAAYMASCRIVAASRIGGVR